MNKIRKISINTSKYYSIPFEHQLKMFSEAGFSHTSLGTFHTPQLDKENAIKTKTLLEEHSIKIDTIHGPRLDIEDAIEYVEHLSELAKDFNIQVIVLHASQFEFPESEYKARHEDLIKKYASIEKIADKYNVKYAIENVIPGHETELVRQTVSEFNSPLIGYCYDSSHDQIYGPHSYEVLENFSEKLYAVHLSDRKKEFVDHLIPGNGFIDFDTICKLIKKSGFNSPLLFEVMTLNSEIKDNEQFIRMTYEKGCKLYDLIWD